MFPRITDIIESLTIQHLSEQRKQMLYPLIEFIQINIDLKQAIHLNFICTHNSRRSHLAQVWAQVMTEYFNVPNLYCYSGGTEKTALAPKVAETLKKSGFKISRESKGSNPIYSIQYSENNPPILAFSKKFDDSVNPSSNFAAILTCSSANESCPIVQGAEKRIPITFDDPKLSDGTLQQDKVYLERSLEIATNMFYVFSKINIKP